MVVVMMSVVGRGRVQAPDEVVRSQRDADTPDGEEVRHPVAEGRRQLLGSC